MRIHQLLIVPAAGWSAGDGTFTRGHELPNVAEIDVVDRYVRGIVDEVNEAGIRHALLPVRVKPGVPEGSRHRSILPNTLVLHCRVGWCDKSPSRRPTANKSATYIGQHSANELSILLSEAMAHWGQLYASHDHRGSNPVVDNEDKLLNVAGASGIRIEPFILNGPSSDDYCKRLDALGRDIGRTIADYIIAKQTAARSAPSGIDGSLAR